MALKSKKQATAGWEDMPTSTVLRRGIFLDIVGLEGSGKSSLALTAPGPVGYIDIDQSVDRARKPDGFDGKVLPVRYAVGMGLSKDAVKAECHEAWEVMTSRIRDAINGWAKSIVIDTDTENWELKRLASFGELNPKGRRMDRLYGPVNAQFRQLHRDIYRNASRHLVTVHQMKDEYKDVVKSDGEVASVKTGRHVSAGFKEIGYLADMRVRCFKEDGEFRAEILMCKLPPVGPSMEGSIIEPEDLTFAKIIAMVTATDPEDWE